MFFIITRFSTILIGIHGNILISSHHATAWGVEGFPSIFLVLLCDFSGFLHGIQGIRFLPISFTIVKVSFGKTKESVVFRFPSRFFVGIHWDFSIISHRDFPITIFQWNPVECFNHVPWQISHHDVSWESIRIFQSFLIAIFHSFPTIVSFA